MCNIQEKLKINKYEKVYFNKIKEIIENNGTTIFRNLTTQYNFESLSDDFGGASEISDAMERVVQSIISEQSDWEIFSSATSSDSAFITPKCIIQIDSKATLVTDGDSTGHKITVGKNQISYASNREGIIFDEIPFKSNIPYKYNHKIYGDTYSATYFVKLHYDNSNGIDSFKDFKVYLACVPNGLLKDIYGEDIFDAGRGLSTPLYEVVDLELYNSVIVNMNQQEINLFNSCYDLDINSNIRTLKRFFMVNGNSIKDSEKKLKKELKELYKNKNINKQRDTIRIKLQSLQLNNESQYHNSEFNWKRYVELDLI